MTSPSPHPTSSLPSSPSSEKSRRYDRQLRLWGDHGQHALERSHVLLLGSANATACETLKSLVLPGIGAFTIVDDKKLTLEVGQMCIKFTNIHAQNAINRFLYLNFYAKILPAKLFVQNLCESAFSKHRCALV